MGNLVAISDCNGNVGASVDHPEVELPLKPNGKIDVGGGVGCQGRLAGIGVLGEKDPYIGQVELVSGEIAEDREIGLPSSEHIPTVCALAVPVDKERGEARSPEDCLFRSFLAPMTPLWTVWSRISLNWILFRLTHHVGAERK